MKSKILCITALALSFTVNASNSIDLKSDIVPFCGLVKTTDFGGNTLVAMPGDSVNSSVEQITLAQKKGGMIGVILLSNYPTNPILNWNVSISGDATADINDNDVKYIINAYDEDTGASKSFDKGSLIGNKTIILEKNNSRTIYPTIDLSSIDNKDLLVGNIDHMTTLTLTCN